MNDFPSSSSAGSVASPAGGETRSAIPGVTGNARLMLGYVAGALTLTEERAYRLIDVDAEAGWQTFEFVRTGNTFRMSIEQIGGVE